MGGRSRGSRKSKEEELDKNGGAETRVDLADDDAEGRKLATHAAVASTSAEWPPSVKLEFARAGTSPLGGHFVEVLVAAAEVTHSRLSASSFFQVDSCLRSA